MVRKASIDIMYVKYLDIDIKTNRYSENSDGSQEIIKIISKMKKKS